MHVPFQRRYEPVRPGLDAHCFTGLPGTLSPSPPPSEYEGSVDGGNDGVGEVE